MNAESLCWRCSNPQGFCETPCKHCGAINPNVDLSGALAQQHQPDFPKLQEPSMTDDEAELAQDLRLYGSCYWKYIDGKKVRVPIEKVRYINNEAFEVGGETVNRATRTSSLHGAER